MKVEEEGKGLVWARRNVAIATCPVSYVTAESETLVEEFFVRRRLGTAGYEDLTARQVEAFVILEREMGNEQQQRRQIV
jgi:hypothetical protein